MKLDSVKDLHNEIFCLSQERDFFKGKFTEQVTEIATLQEQLKRAKKEIDKLREDLISMDQVHGNPNVDADVQSLAGTVTSPTGSPSRRKLTSSESVSSIARLNINDTHKDENDIEKEEAEKHDSESAENAADSTFTSVEKNAEREEQDSPRQTPSSDESENQEESDEEGDIKDDQTETTEAENIRKNAAKMLIWANYQCARKPSTRSVASTTGSTQSPLFSTTDQDFSAFSTSAAESHATSPPMFRHSPSVPQTIHATTPERPSGPLAKIKQFLDPSLSSSSPDTSNGDYDSDSDFGSDYESESELEDSPPRRGRLASLEHMVTSL